MDLMNFEELLKKRPNSQKSWNSQKKKKESLLREDSCHSANP